jgi:hypothetical protein
VTVDAVDTGSKFSASVNDTRGQVAAGVVDEDSTLELQNL